MIRNSAAIPNPPIWRTIWIPPRTMAAYTSIPAFQITLSSDRYTTWRVRMGEGWTNLVRDTHHKAAG